MVLRLKKAQLSVEFLLALSVALLIFAFVIGFYTLNMHELQEKKELAQITSIADGIIFELKIADSAKEGYEREFAFPKDIEGNDYELILTGEYITLNYRENSIEQRIPSMTGTILKGKNHITKKDGMVFCNG